MVPTYELSTAVFGKKNSTYNFFKMIFGNENGCSCELEIRDQPACVYGPDRSAIEPQPNSIRAHIRASPA